MIFFNEEVAAFALATFGESINPGPTLAVLVSARTRSRLEAWGVVIGVVGANLIWVGAVLAAKYFLLSPQVEPYLKALTALLLVFMATRASAGAMISGIKSYILKDWSAPIAAAPKNEVKSFTDGLGMGFFVHLLNPLSVTYYLGAYSGMLAKDPTLAITFSFIAVGIDFVLYGILALLPIGRLITPSRVAFVGQRIFALLAGFAMLFLVARVFAIDQGNHAATELHGLRSLLMLLGFLAGAIWEAELFARHYGRKKNKLLWRGVLVWQSAFGAFAIIGAFVSVVGRVDPDSLGIDKPLLNAMAICSLVAAVATATLSYARARGEMLDEVEAASNEGKKKYLPQALNINSPKVVFPVLLSCLIALAFFFVKTGFSDQADPSAATNSGQSSNHSSMAPK